MEKGRLIALIIGVILPLEVWSLEPAGARLQAMGGAGVATAEGAATVYYNPAGIYFQDRMAMDFTGRLDALAWQGIWGISYLKYVKSNRSGAGFGIYRMKLTGDLYGGDAVCTQLATVSLTPLGFPSGLTFKYINEKIGDGDRQSYFSMDFGLILPAGGWLIGFNWMSLTDPDSRIFPARLLLGVSKRLGRAFQAAVQAGFTDWETLRDFDQEEIRGGIELQPWRVFSLQAGFVSASESDYWTGGIGILSRDGVTRLYLAYQWYPDRDFDDRLFVSYNYYLK